MAIPLHKRRKVADFDPVRDGKTITQFCKELGISRQTYHNIKDRIAQKGRAGIVPDSTAPKHPAGKFEDADKISVVHARCQMRVFGTGVPETHSGDPDTHRTATISVF